MALVLIFLLGAGHGLQPDHATAAATLAARHRTAAWVAALRLAAGHCAALLMLAGLSRLTPALQLPWLDKWGAVLGAGALIVAGGLLLLQLRHPSVEEPRRQSSLPLVALGWLFGVSGARAAALMLPLMRGPHSVAGALLAYCVGITGGILVVSAGLDVLRALMLGRLSSRWLDGALGLSSIASGCWLLHGAVLP